MVRFIRWVARLWSIVGIVFILVIFFGQGFHPTTMGGIEWIKFIFIPLGALAGLIQGWKKEALGGTVTVFSFIAFSIVTFISTHTWPDRLYFLMILVPGLIYLLYRLMTQRERTS